ncbi:MAG: homoaconitase small subunit [Methanosphaera sp.]|uniref:homoaconitase small subunit n=1 Tax=Methanosphaera sp. TaxID=2666342 RepID=UPI002E764B0C|nr:homoaconitase small subunit [Methanosphaera sp.]MEE1117242.1 homoaconitase small subunit [Methanosphaera sp.]MEE3324014.1 homoaconitase small subunit [Methanosphaera sp.]MEE3418138.1 homoaconitase small subunit [Methanosphaera sp.]
MDIMKGKVWKFRDSIDTDVIIAGRYLRTFNPQDLADHVMEAEDPEFSQKVNKGDIIVAGWNFGCGSSREQAPVAIKTAGVSVVIAKSFARIFYRNAINIGLPVITADIDVDEGDIVEVNVEEGTITNITKENTVKFKPFDPTMLNILENGGLVEQYLKNKGEE